MTSAESVTTRGAASDSLKGHPQRALMVLGDVNDEVESATTQIRKGPPGPDWRRWPWPPGAGDAERL